MRQFKHKKTGDIAEKAYDFFYSLKDDCRTMPIRFIENTNDWEEILEVKEPNYLITCFENKEGIVFNLSPDGKYASFRYPEINFSKEEMLFGNHSVESGRFFIKSVKNSKGIEFSVGDYYDNDYISKFTVGVNGDDTRIYVISKNHSQGLELDSLVKMDQPKPVLVTHDGVEMFDYYGTVYSVLCKGTWQQEKTQAHQATYKGHEWKVFSTKEARREYIKQHAPLYSLEDVEKAYNNIPDKKTITFKELLNGLKGLNK